MVFERKVSPSLLAADYGRLGEEAVDAEKGGAESLHLDYMDGHYVANISFGIDLIPTLKKRVSIPLLAHLMISNAEERLDDFIEAGPDYIILQEDAVRDIPALITRMRARGIKPGLAISPPRPLEKIAAHLPLIDFLLVLSVNPGFGGQTFMPETLAKMREAHDHRVKSNLAYDIGVDGGVNRDTAVEIVKTGANVLIAGTAIFGTGDIAGAIDAFYSL
jgi:ribulose-phosphate 3-epimerase